MMSSIMDQHYGPPCCDSWRPWAVHWTRSFLGQVSCVASISAYLPARGARR